MRDNKKILKEFESTVKKVAKSHTVGSLFTEFKKAGGTRVQCMIVDSAIKGADLGGLYTTLLLFENKYYELLQSATEILNKMPQKKTLFNILSRN